MIQIRAPRITDLDGLQLALQKAIELEHATIPPYLCALYSIKDGSNQEIAGLIHSVVIEEMLHMALDCNILNAIGGRPAINKPGFVPTYPGPLPMGIGSEHGDPFIVHLRPFSLEQNEDTFMVIEEPEDPIDFAAEESVEYRTIGEFYAGIAKVIQEMGNDIFTGDPARQLTTWYGQKNELIAVSSVKTALEAIDLIVEQGEGTDKTPLDEEGELAHFYKFSEINAGKRLVKDPSAPNGWSYNGAPIPFDPAGVYPMQDDPNTAELPAGSGVRKLSAQFNQIYTNLLNALHITFNGQPGYISQAMGLMYSLKLQAQDLMQAPVPGTDQTAGPAFQFAEP